LRRLYLQRISCHLYYTHDDREVIVRALWGARRERGPALRAASIENQTREEATAKCELPQRMLMHDRKQAR
jgi:hypothetical protein